MALQMRWADVHFAHWRVPPRAVRRHVPRSLEIDAVDGQAWVSLVAQRTQGTRLGALPAGSQDYAQVNVRTYVRHGSASGIWLMATYVTAPDAAAGAQAMGLPYQVAEMDVRPGQADVASPRAFSASWTPGAPEPPAPLGVFLTERRFLFAQAGRVLMRITAQHAPWHLQPARAEVHDARQLPRMLRRAPDLAHVAEPVDVAIQRPWRIPR